MFCNTSNKRDFVRQNLKSFEEMEEKNGVSCVIEFLLLDLVSEYKTGEHMFYIVCGFSAR